MYENVSLVYGSTLLNSGYQVYRNPGPASAPRIKNTTGSDRHLCLLIDRDKMEIQWT
jgi:hypothetical protein